MEMNKLPIVKIKADAPKTLSNAWASITIILNQFPNIADGWNSINEAKYKIEKFRVVMKIIYSNVDKMSDADIIIDDLRKLWVSTADSHGKAELMFQIRKETSRLNRLHVSTTSKIGTNSSMSLDSKRSIKKHFFRKPKSKSE